MGVGVVLALLTGCERAKNKASTDAPAAPPPAVVIVTVVPQTVPISTELIARTEAVQTVEIRARVEGVLEQVLFKEGSEVIAGQVLFALDRRVYEAALQSARAQLARAQADLARAQESVDVQKARAQLDQVKASLAVARRDVARLRPLAEERAVPQQDLDHAVAREQVAAAALDGAEAAVKDAQLNQRIGIDQGRASVEAARAAVTEAELRLGYTTIRAPIAGVIGRLNVNKGNLVGKNEPTLLATMSSADPMKVVFSASELDYLGYEKRRLEGRSEPTPAVELILADNSQYPHRGKLTTIDRTLDPKTGTIVLEALFPNPGKLLRPGQFGRVRAIVEERPNALLVPQRAVQEIQGSKTVLVVGEGNKVSLRTVKLAERYGNHVIVSEGLKPGERVVVEGLQKARPGTQVDPRAQPLTDEKK